ncbi:MAG TPA: T9SS type A sorting domain-containing protein [Bacteroidia bacterium]|jgi:hypothetical protein|nr:T9SS type A sorting domain-containing protein [Bacteroidia bacterium]
MKKINVLIYVLLFCLGIGTANAGGGMLTLSSTTFPATSCGTLGANGAIEITATGGVSPYTYQWSNGQTTATAIHLAAGSYTCTVTDSVGHTASINKLVQNSTRAAVITSQTNPQCNGAGWGTATVILKNGVYPCGYTWSNGQTTSTASLLTPGTYTVTVVDNFGCGGATRVTITQPAVLTTSSSTTTTSACNQSTGSATITATGGTAPYTYSWAPSGGTSALATNLAAGSYTCTIRDHNGCGATNSKIVQNTGAVISINGQTNVLCNGSSNGAAKVTMTGGTAPYTYLWSSGATTSIATNLAANTYTVTITDNNGCEGLTRVTITQPALLRDSITTSSCATSDSGSGSGSATVLAKGGTAPYTYAWSPSGGSAATGVRLSPGTYTVTVTDRNKCSTQALATVDLCPIIIRDAAVKSVPNTEYNITLYPNPNNGQFTVTGLEEGGTVEMYNTMGALVRIVSVNDNTMQFNTSDLASGIYLLRVISKNGTIIAQRKMVKTL